MSVAEAVQAKTFRELNLEEKLDRLAEVAVKVGLGLKEGQELIMTAPMDALPLARKITEQAYKAGAKLVTTFYSDDASVLARYQYAPDASFDYAPTWLQDAIANGFRSGAARLAIAGANPALLARQDPAKVARTNVAASKAGKAAMELITFDGDGNCIGANLMDYLVPTAWETPEFDLGELVTPSPHHPIGAKGVGESATVGSPAAYVNAVIDALWQAGVRNIDMPLSPDKVWQALAEAGLAE